MRLILLLSLVLSLGNNLASNVNVNLLLHEGRPECMVGLRDLPRILTTAAWTQGSTRMVMLSLADGHGVHQMLPVFIRFLDGLDGSGTRPKRQGITQHFLMVALGESYLRCQDLKKAGYSHHCLIDFSLSRFCQRGDHRGQGSADSQEVSEMKWKDSRFQKTMLQKLRWAVAILKLRVSVVTVDLDVVLFNSPFPFLSSLSPDTDFAIASEIWEERSSFSTDTCLFTKPYGGCKIPGQLNSGNGDDPGICCDMTMNSGFWFANGANSGGLAIVNAWLARFYYLGVVQGEWLSGKEPALDQEVLNELLLNPANDPELRSIPVFKMGSNGSGLTRAGSANRSLNERIRRISVDRVGNNCLGWSNGDAYCGISMGKTILSRFTGVETKLTCAMPPGHLDKILIHHMTCISNIQDKMKGLRRWLNWTLSP